MSTDRLREINFYTRCLRRDEPHMDTYDPAYFPRLRETWKIYRRCGLDTLFEPSPEEREQLRQVLDAIEEKVTWLDKLGILHDNDDEEGR